MAALMRGLPSGQARQRIPAEAVSGFGQESPAVRKNSIRVTRSDLLQPVLVVQFTKYSLASENFSRRKVMTMGAHWWRWLDRVRNARTETGVNSGVMVMGAPVCQELFQTPAIRFYESIGAELEEWSGVRIDVKKLKGLVGRTARIS